MLTKDQQAFLQERAQQQLVGWCDMVLRGGDTKATITLDRLDPYVRYACDRKTPWLSDKGSNQFYILGPGWKAASTFLKR